MKMEKNNSSDRSHFLQAKEVISSWPKWKQETAYTSSNENTNQSCETNKQEE